MNILIIGGLLGLAVLAILGAVLLGMGEDRAEKAKKEAQAQQTSAPALPSPQIVSQGPTYQSVPATPLLSRATITLPVSSAGQITGDLSLADLNGQVREITGELHALAQRASELQQRLSTLSETLEEHDQLAPEASHVSAPADFFNSSTDTQVFDH